MRLSIIATAACITGIAMATPEQSVTISSDNKPVLQIKTTGKTEVTPIGNKTVVHTPDMYLHIWTQPKGSTVKSTVNSVNSIIKGDFIKFTPKTIKSQKLGENIVQLIAGPGIEADDEDDGNAEVAIFKIGDRVFVTCIHGEGPVEKTEHDAMIAAIKSAQKPPSK
jgi:hypothetical protein